MQRRPISGRHWSEEAFAPTAANATGLNRRIMMLRKTLLTCGILAALLYVGSDILAAMQWEGYSYTARSVSELRAIGAPTRAFLLPILTLYSVLELAFSVGIWGAAAPKGLPKRSLRVAALLLFGLSAIDLTVAPFFPVHLGEPVAGFANTMHVILTGVTVLFILLIIGFGAGADGKWFRFYSYASIVILIATGAWAFLDLPNVEAHLPTPWMGVRERINIYGYMLWLMVLAFVLLRAQVTKPTHKPSASVGTSRPIPG
jgi:hypothetical protein